MSGMLPADARPFLRSLHRAGEGDGDAARAVLARVAWNVMAEPGDGVAGLLVASLGPEGALRAVADGVPCPPELSPRELREGIARWTPRMTTSALADVTSAARRISARLLVPGDPEWPDVLADLGAHAPLALWVRGSMTGVGDAPSVALVGARASTGYGDDVAGEMSAELSGSGVVVVSGAAYGIDGSAHRAALAGGGRTVAFLAGGVDRPYPAGHRDLIERMAERGAVVSETPCATAPTKWRFLARNRLIAALARATVVVEAGWRSGSLNTAGHAAALGRPLGAVPGPVTSAASAGCHRILREMDAVCVRGADDVREMLGLGRGDESGPAGRTGTDTRLLDALSARVPRRSTEIARRAGLAPAEVESRLGFLLLEGEVTRAPEGWQRATGPR